LKYESDSWNYCKGDDRRFYPEILNGIKPAGATQMTKEEKAPHLIPEGTYGKDITKHKNETYCILKQLSRCWRRLLRTD